MPKAHSILLYADSGDTKTSQVALAAKYIYEKTGKKTRLISADGGGWEPCKPLIELGIIDAFDISGRKFALADCRRLSEGYWPRIQEKEGRKVRVFKTVPECLTTAEEWKGLGLLAIEQITSISSMLLSHISNQEESMGFKQPYNIEEDGYHFGGVDKGHYGLVQRELHRLIVHGFETLPIPMVMFTAIVGKGTLRRTGDTIYGPQAAGEAITSELPTWVGDCLHLERLIVDVEENGEPVQREKIVAWFQKHTDSSTGVQYLAKTRVPPEMYPHLLKITQGRSYVPMTFGKGIGTYLEILEILGRKATEELKKEWKDKLVTETQK